MVIYPSTESELKDALNSYSEIRLSGTASNRTIPPYRAEAEVNMTKLCGIQKVCREDQVLVVKAGTLVSDINNELRSIGLCLPIAETFGSIGGWIASGRPHVLEGTYRPWRDWITGMKFVLADGTVAKSGSEVVKSVAGYDLHRFLVGSRGTLAVLLEVTLRIRPFAELNPPVPVANLQNVNFILRTLSSEFESRVSSLDVEPIYVDRATATFYGMTDNDPLIEPCENEWIVSPWHAESSPRLSKAKQLFDPTNKLNRGMFGETS